MAMQMQRAFNARMLTKVGKFTQADGSFNDLNVWLDGSVKESSIYGVILAGNKFSQFEEGMALHNEDGGIRYSDYRTIFITDKFSLELQDKVKFRNIYYNVLQQSDETEYGFSSYLIEKSENWKP